MSPTHDPTERPEVAAIETCWHPDEALRTKVVRTAEVVVTECSRCGKEVEFEFSAQPVRPEPLDVERLARAGLGVERRVAVETRPEIVCLCGSTRFYDEFQQANYDLTMAGKIVLSVGFYPHAKAEHGHGEGIGHDSAEKVALDELHKRKIDLADRVLVLNIGGYIGQSTRNEIDYAIAHGKPIDYREASEPEGAKE